MDDNKQVSDAVGYLGEFADNLLGGKNPDRKEVMQKTVEHISSETGVRVDSKEIENKVDDEDGSNLGVIQTKFNLFPEAKNWKDVAKEISAFGWNAQKEILLLQVFGAGLAVVVLDTTNTFRFIVGPAMIRYSYGNSKVLQKLVHPDEIKQKIDLEKGFAKDS